MSEEKARDLLRRLRSAWRVVLANAQGGLDGEGQRFIRMSVILTESIIDEINEILGDGPAISKEGKNGRDSNSK
jgi:hypothetical protein